MTTLESRSDVRYEPFASSMLEEVTHLIAAAFTRDEPMARCLRIPAERFAQRLMPEARWFAEEGASIVARQPASGEIVGAALLKDFVAEPDGGSDLPDQRFLPVFALLQDLSEQYRADREVPPGTYLEITLLAVRATHRRRGIADRLVQLALEQAAGQGYRVAVAEATGAASQALLRDRHGFLDRVKVDYRHFTHQGRKIFAGISVPRYAIFMEKPLA